MKKTIVAILVLMLIAALTLPALALTMYVTKDSAKVYNKKSKESKVISHLPIGGAVEVQEQDGNWVSIHYINKKGVTKAGWMSVKNLTDKKPHKHKWGDWKVTKQATCTEEGAKQRACTECGKTQTKTIAKLGHDWGKWKVTKEATCVKEGQRTRICSRCDKKQTEKYTVDHTFGSWTMTVEPTCSEKGERVRTCEVCGKQETQALNTLPHDFSWRVTLEPTDHSAGTRAKICVNCGINGGEESFDPEGTLRRKDRGEDVYNMQQLLVEQGYLNVGGADGIFGGSTEKALMQYQKDRDLNPDGVAWPQTLDDLQHDFGPWQTVKEMTRTEAGERMRVCRGCGFEQHETVEAGEVFERKRRGEDIRAMQQILNELGYDAGGYDGIYGKKLDSALADFAADHGFVTEEGVIRPGDVDEVFNAWLESLPAERWKGEGNLESPVDLALSVTDAGDADDSGIVNYTWSLTNLGSENVTFAALLLSFGDTPDFKGDSMVMKLEGYALKGNSGNSISGAFSADEDWEEGNLNFAALAMNDETGDMWLSNSIAFENSHAPKARTIYPVAGKVDVNNIRETTLPVAFNPGDVASVTSGVFFNAVHIYTLDSYDPADIAGLKEGDTLVVSGQEVPVNSIRRSGDEIIVNGGLDEGGFGLWMSPNYDGYVVHLDGDMVTYTEQGVTTLMLDNEATFTDAWDIGSDPVTVGYEGIADAVRNSENSYFVQYNTTVDIVDGRITAINRVYVP